MYGEVGTIRHYEISTFHMAVFLRELFFDFGEQKGKHIRDRLVVGISDKELSEILQLKAGLVCICSKSSSDPVETRQKSD